MKYNVGKGMRQWVLSLLTIVLVSIGSAGFVAYGQENNNDIEVKEGGKKNKGVASSATKAPGEQKAKEQDPAKGADSLEQRLTLLTKDVDSLRGQLEHLTSAANAVKRDDTPWYQSMWLVIAPIVLTVLIAIIAVLAKLGPKSDKPEGQSDIDRDMKELKKATQEPDVSGLKREIEQLKKDLSGLEGIAKEQADKIRSLQGSLNERSVVQTSAPSNTPSPVPGPVANTKVEYIEGLPNKDASFLLKASQPPYKCYFVVHNGSELHLRERLSEAEVDTLKQDSSKEGGLYRIEGQGPLLREKEAGTVVGQEGRQYKVVNPLVLEAYDKN